MNEEFIEALCDHVKKSSVNSGAMMTLLIEKGIFTKEEAAERIKLLENEFEEMTK